jgi:hypothetical protein
MKKTRGQKSHATVPLRFFFFLRPSIESMFFTVQRLSVWIQSMFFSPSVSTYGLTNSGWSHSQAAGGRRRQDSDPARPRLLAGIGIVVPNKICLDGKSLGSDHTTEIMLFVAVSQGQIIMVLDHMGRSWGWTNDQGTL